MSISFNGLPDPIIKIILSHIKNPNIKGVIMLVSKRMQLIINDLKISSDLKMDDLIFILDPTPMNEIIPFPPGAIYWIGTNEGNELWKNPYPGTVDIKMSHPFHQITMGAKNLLDLANPAVTFWGGSSPLWFIVDLKNYYVKPTHFIIRHGYNAPNSFIKTLLFHASVDGNNWIQLLREETVAWSRISFSVKLFILEDDTFYRYFRCTQYGNHTENLPYMCVSGFDVYGQIVKDSSQPLDYYSF